MPMRETAVRKTIIPVLFISIAQLSQLPYLVSITLWRIVSASAKMVLVVSGWLLVEPN
jgi:hypothetical protein